jgi:hypothetical protein
MGFDADGNMWCGVNWLPGSQSGVLNRIGGGLIKFSPNGTALSPAITGFTGMGVDGIGWGTAVALDKVWVASFNGAIGVHDFQGRPIGKETDIPFAGKTGGLMGVSVAANGDVWIADGTKNQLLYFPGGRVEDGRIVQVAGLKSPFDIAIDAQNRVWVSKRCTVQAMCAARMDVCDTPSEKPSAKLDRSRQKSPACASRFCEVAHKDMSGADQDKMRTGRSIYCSPIIHILVYTRPFVKPGSSCL